MARIVGIGDDWELPEPTRTRTREGLAQVDEDGDVLNGNGEKVGTVDPEAIATAAADAVGIYMVEHPIEVDGLPEGGGVGQVLGRTGPDEADWIDVPTGASAYEIAVARGFVGTEVEWLASLQGEPGGTGGPGPSAYEVAVADGFVGTEAEWLTSLTGPPGESGDPGSPWVPPVFETVDDAYDAFLANEVESGDVVFVEVVAQ